MHGFKRSFVHVLNNVLFMQILSDISSIALNDVSSVVLNDISFIVLSKIFWF